MQWCDVLGKECRSEREAKKLGRHDRGTAREVEPFRCRYCGYWHTGKSSQSEMRVREYHPVLGRIVRKHFV